MDFYFSIFFGSYCVVKMTDYSKRKKNRLRKIYRRDYVPKKKKKTCPYTEIQQHSTNMDTYQLNHFHRSAELNFKNNLTRFVM